MMAADSIEYSPGPQSIQGASPTSALNLPGVQAEHWPEPAYPASQAHAVLPAAEEELAGQDSQVFSDRAPVAVEKVPALHSEHAALPLASLYLLASHAVHAPPCGPEVPAMQAQSTKRLEPAALVVFAGHALQVSCDMALDAVEYVSAPHSAHAALPGSDWYFPASQTAQGPPAGPDVPALHIQEVAERDPGELLEFAGQRTQVCSLVAPTSAEYVSASHAAQAPLPVATLYFPASQREHGAPALFLVLPALQMHAVLSVLPAGASEFAGHCAHVALDAEPTASENLPCPHSLHPALPAALLNLPATQLVQSPPCGPVDPALHLHVQVPDSDSKLAAHASHAVAATEAEYFPASQSKHAPLPVPALYLPAVHSTHLPPFGPDEPALQTHSSASVLATGE
jgi:hypothetical protein